MTPNNSPSGRLRAFRGRFLQGKSDRMFPTVLLMNRAWMQKDQPLSVPSPSVSTTPLRPLDSNSIAAMSSFSMHSHAMAKWIMKLCMTMDTWHFMFYDKLVKYENYIIYPMIITLWWGWKQYLSTNSKFKGILKVWKQQ